MRTVEDRVEKNLVSGLCIIAVFAAGVLNSDRLLDNVNNFLATIPKSDVLPPIPGIPEPLPTKIPISITPAKIPSSLELSSFLKRNDCNLEPGLAAAGLPITGLLLTDELTIVCTKPINGQTYREMRRRVAKTYDPFRERTVENPTRRFKHRFQRIAGN